MILYRFRPDFTNMTLYLQLARLELIFNRRLEWLQVKLSFTNDFFAPVI